MLNTRFSILLNTENIEYRIFNITEYRKKLQYRSSIVLNKKLNKNPRPTIDVDTIASILPIGLAGFSIIERLLMYL